MANWSIRSFQIGDYAEARALWDACEGIGLDQSDSREQIQTFLTRNPGLSAVVDLGGAIVGAVLCGQDGRRGFIYHLAVASSHRRQGMGGALVKASLSALREQGIRKCHIMVFNHNHDASQFWTRLGAKVRTDVILSSMTIEGAV
jgi:N-acetylglutamate synthase